MTLRDLPDYTRQMVIRYEGGFVGLEELAVRLGFIGPFDLRGNVILMEDFESEETELILVQAGGSSLASRSSRHKFSGDWSMKLYTDDVADAYSSMERQFEAPGEGKIAIFARLGFAYLQTEVVFWGYGQVGTTGYNFVLRYRGAAQELAYLDENGDYQTIASSLLLGLPELNWYPFLLVVDLSTGYYEKAIVNNVEYDLSGYKMWSGTSGYAPYGSVVVYSNAVGALGGTFYVDDIIVLKNVP